MYNIFLFLFLKKDIDMFMLIFIYFPIFIDVFKKKK